MIAVQWVVEIRVRKALNHAGDSPRLQGVSYFALLMRVRWQAS